LFDEAHAIYAKALGEQHAQTAYATSGSGRARLALGELAAARTTLAAAVATLEQTGVDPVLLARTRLPLARAPYRLRDRAAGVALAAQALPDLEKLGPNTNTDLRSQIVSWRATHH